MRGAVDGVCADAIGDGTATSRAANARGANEKVAGENRLRCFCGELVINWVGAHAPWLLDDCNAATDAKLLLKASRIIFDPANCLCIGAIGKRVSPVF